MDNNTAALTYLDNLNIFLYKPSLLPNVVFSNPQVLLDMLSKLVVHSYKLRGTGGIEKLSCYYVPDLFSRNKFVALL